MPLIYGGGTVIDGSNLKLAGNFGSHLEQALAAFLDALRDIDRARDFRRYVLAVERPPESLQQSEQQHVAVFNRGRGSDVQS